jgi:hypothetical protein
MAVIGGIVRPETELTALILANRTVGRLLLTLLLRWKR